MTKSNVNRGREKLLVNDIHKAKAILKNINWNFYQKGAFSPYEIRPFNCRKYHWFPATFVPEIPFTLIEVLTLPNAVVYDPFAGIGTTYFQALLLNRKPLTTEICRVAVEYMQSLFILFNPQLNLDALVDNVKQIINGFTQNIDYTANVSDNGSINSLVDKLKPWYHPKTFNQLSFLFISEHYCDDVKTKAAMRISLSAILKGLSCQEGGGSYVADNVLPKPWNIREKNALKRFLQHINLLVNGIKLHIKNTNQSYLDIYNEISNEKTIFYEDLRKERTISDNSVDLIVTSPPYPNMTDYVNSQRLSYYWLGLDPSIDLQLEIGARYRRSNKKALEMYSRDMQKVNRMLHKKIKSEGYLCYILPVFDKDNENNRTRSRVIKEVLLDLEQHGFDLECDFERIIPSRRRYHSLWATLKREKIYVYKKE